MGIRVAVTEPDNGIGIQQPGSWMYSILPFHEEQAVFDMGAGLNATQKLEANALRLQTPLPIHYCPSRRAATAYPASLLQEAYVRKPIGSNEIRMGAHNDYAANAGEGVITFGGGPSNPLLPDQATPFPIPGNPTGSSFRTASFQ